MPPWLGGQKEDTVCGQVAGGKKKKYKNSAAGCGNFKYA